MNRTPLSLFLIVPVVSVGLFAQNASKLELFGGYSYFGAGSNMSATSISLDTANLNGWNAAANFGLTPRIGMVADFSGHYGNRDVQLPTGSNPSVHPRPGNMHQYTSLFGPEFRVLKNSRVTVNVRALAGIAHLNTFPALLLQPIQSTPLLIGNSGAPITELTVAGGNGFAASFGGSIDYRINDLLSYRIIQPEYLLTRFSGSTPPNIRVSTGIVLKFGR